MEMSSGSRRSEGQEVLLRCKGAFVRFGPAWRACDILSSCKSILINSRQRLYPGIIMNCERGMVRGCRREYPWVTLGEPRLGWAFLKDLHFISSGWTNLNCPPGRPFQFLFLAVPRLRLRLHLCLGTLEWCCKLQLCEIRINRSVQVLPSCPKWLLNPSWGGYFSPTPWQVQVKNRKFDYVKFEC